MRVSIAVRAIGKVSNPQTFTMTRGMATSAKFDIATPYKTHLFEAPEQSCTATKEEMLSYHKMMYGMRRMEITCDQEYKARTIRGFCHLYDGQEAVAMGMEAALTREDDWITSYRCHGVALVRGCTYQEIFEELFGFRGGVVGGKGGSMHLYSKKSNFYGGAAIVGAQMPVGTGLAFAQKYKASFLEGKAKTPVSVAVCGDGAINQGQVWEGANMASLWKLPIIYIIENNRYGMGTSSERSSTNTEYYKQGNVIPGIQIDGMDVLAVREGMKHVKEYVSNGNGPMFVEMKTYRYHGHSMSDPGISYRSRDEVADMRKSKDPIESTKKRILDAGFATDAELKEVEKEVREEVNNALKLAKEGTEMDYKELINDIYCAKEELGDNNWGKRVISELPKVVRMPDRLKTIVQP